MRTFEQKNHALDAAKCLTTDSQRDAHAAHQQHMPRDLFSHTAD
jgi:hypothetical protein